MLCGPFEQTETCSEIKQCPQAKLCVALKCRADSNGNIQVFHHNKEPDGIHECKMYENVDGSRTCMCTCGERSAEYWNSHNHLIYKPKH